MESKRPIFTMGGIVVDKARLGQVRILLTCMLCSLSIGSYAQCDPLPEEGALCKGETLQLHGNPSGAATYTLHQWEILPFSTATGIVLHDADTESVIVDASGVDATAGTLFLEYRVQDEEGCEGASLTAVIVKPLPSLLIEGEKALCHGGAPVVFSCAVTESGWYESDAPEGFANMGNGQAFLDPGLCPPGIYTITYTAEANGCAHWESIQVEVIDCEAEVVNACSCRPDAENANGNATANGNGQFVETIVFQAPPKQSWYVASNTGFFQPNSPQPPATPLPIPEGTFLVEETPGVYILEGIHLDGAGYQVTATNGQDSITAGNICYYPFAQIMGLDETFCSEDGPVALLGQAGGQTGAGVFAIYGPGDVLLQENITFLDPATLGTGTFRVEYRFDQAPDEAPCTDCYPGCVQAVSQLIGIVDQDEVPVCNDLVQISLDGDCEEELQPDMVLEGTYDQLDAYLVEIFSGVNNLGNLVTGAMIGSEYPVLVTNICTGNSCWGAITVEDKWLPQILCPTAPLPIACLADLETVATPIATDNCDGTLPPVLLNEAVTNLGCDGAGGVIQEITQLWGATDASGNTAIPCQQTVQVIRPTLGDILLPLNRDGVQAPAIPCENAQLDPSVTGYPTWNGYSILEDNGICGISASYTDIELEACGSTFKIVRTWTILDDCAPGEILTGIQVIKVADETPPSLTCPSTLTVNAVVDCKATLNLPAATITDNCNTWTVTVHGPNLFLDGNGGVLSGLELGDYLFEYRATDACGNQGICYTIVHVEDGVAPVVACDEYTVVALEVNGEALVPAAIFDDGSYDFCTPVDFLARRMDQVGAPYTEQVLFTCADLEVENLMVEVQVSDENGNTNLCMVEVDVQDKLPPVVTCPPNLTLDCSADFSDPDLVGTAIVLEGCDYELLFQEQVSLENGCNYGTVTRTFTAVDSTGNQGSCTQTITLEITDPFTEDDIEWPADFTAPECTDVSQLEPDSLPLGPENYQRPIIHGQNCALIGINYEDQYFDITSPACFKIVRTWRIIDWCQFDPFSTDNAGYWEHEQVIKVVDNEPPTITCAFSPFVKLTDPVCYDTVFLEFPVVTDCSPNVEVFAESDLGSGFGPFMNVPLGQYNVTYTVVDNCGNAAICTYVLHVVDGKPPTPFCENGIVAELMQTGMVDINVKQLDAGSHDNCTPTSDLLFSFSYFPGDSMRTYTCQNLGSNTVQVWVTDEEGNTDFCEIDIYIQDNFDVCPPAVPKVAGLVATESGEGVHETLVSVNGIQSGSDLTGPDGMYEVSGLVAGNDYTITPEKTGDWLNGVSTFDLALISKHILQIVPLNSPYKIIAADANRSGVITTLDMVTIQKVILFIADSFTNNTSWRFVPADYVFQNPANPLAEPFPEVININNLPGDLDGQDFIAIKVGDVNGSASGSLQTTEERTTGVPMQLSLSGETLEEGRIGRLTLRAEDLSKWAAFQFTLTFDPEILDLQSVTPGILQDSDIGLAYADAGQITVGWYERGEYLSAADPLATLEFWVKKPENWRQAIRVNGALTPAIAYDATGVASDIYYQFEARQRGASLAMEVYPNPFSGSTLVEYHLVNSTDVRLWITDVSGNVVWEQADFQQAGKHQARIGSDVLSRSGVYHLTMITSEETLTRKLVQLGE